MPLEDTLAKAKKSIAQGFKNLKLKGGKNVEEDIEKVIRIREVAGSAINIRFDANQGYSVEEAIHFINRTKTSEVEIFEQPTDKKNDALIKEVTGRVHVPVMADEALVTLKDAFRLTSSNSMDMINIKLMKVGGITEAMHVNSVAKAAGIEAMVGCMDESALGIAAGLHFALSKPNIIYADLDGHLDFIDDPFADMLRIEKGVMYPSELPGLGVVKQK